MKTWYEGVITPDFQTVEARKARGLIRENQDVDPIMFPATPSTKDVTGENFDTEATLPDRLIEAAKDYNKPWPENPAHQRSCLGRVFGKMNRGSVRTCSASLAATALGSGALALPFAFSLTGVVLGILTMVLAAMVSALSLQILMVAARYSDCKSYASLLELTVGNRCASILLDVMITCNGIGAITSILIFEGDFLPSVLSSPPWGGGWNVARHWTVIGIALAAWPLTWPRKISALRYASVAKIIVLIGTIILVIIQMFSSDELKKEMNVDAAEGAVMWHFTVSDWLKAVAVMVNAFANHQNAIPSVNELEHPSIARVVKATVYGNMMVWVVLVLLGVGGYVTWGSATHGNFITNYPSSDKIMWSCRVMLALACYLVLPVALFPTSKSCAQLVLQVRGRSEPTRTVGRVLHISTATLLLAIITTLAIAITDVTVVLGVLGGVIASSLMFWFPALVYWKFLWPTQPRCVRLPILLSLLFLGICGWASVPFA
jgi:amino acid permease